MSYDHHHSDETDNPFELLRRRILEICHGDEDDLMEQKTRLHQMGEMLSEVVTAVEAQTKAVAGLRADVDQARDATATIANQVATLGGGRAQLDTQSADYQEALARKALHAGLTDASRITPSAGLLPQGAIPSISTIPKSAFLLAKKQAGESTSTTTQQRG